MPRLYMTYYQSSIYENLYFTRMIFPVATQTENIKLTMHIYICMTLHVLHRFRDATSCLPMNTLPTRVQRSWPPSPTLGWSWKTGLPPYQSGHVRRTGVCLYAGPTFWNSLPENLENIKSTLSVFTRFFFFSYCTFSAFEVSIRTRYGA